MEKISTSTLKNNSENSTKESSEFTEKYIKENNKINEELSLKDFLKNESQSKHRQASDEFLFNLEQKENLNRIKVIKNNKIQKNKNTSKIVKDQYKKKKKKYILQ